jgi:uncharacterized membrane protein YkvI
MYLVFAFYLVQILAGSEVSVLESVRGGEVVAGWFTGGLLYATYNGSMAPVLLFSTRAIQTRREAIVSGFIAGIAVMIPVLLFHLSYTAGYPAVLEQDVPNYWMISEYGSPLLLGLFMVALLGTMVETGAGMVQGVIERIEAVVKPGEDEGLGHLARLSVAFITLLLSGLVGLFGIVDLIARGYTTMAWGFVFIYIIPIITWGVFRVLRAWGQPPGT